MKTKTALTAMGTVLIAVGVAGRFVVMDRKLKIKHEISVMMQCQIDIMKLADSLGVDPNSLKLPDTVACTEAQRYMEKPTPSE